LFIKSGETYKKIATAEIGDTGAGAGQLHIEYEAYQDMPRELNFPLTLNITMT